MPILKFEGISKRDYWLGQEKQRLIELLTPLIVGGRKPAKEAVKNIVKGELVAIEVTDINSAQMLMPKLEALGCKVSLER